MMCTKRLAGALLVLLAASGCVSRSASLDSAPASDRPVPEMPTTPTAADGTDLDACADGNCEVLIESSAVVPVPGGTLTLTLTEDDGFEYEMTINGNTGSGSAKGNCVSTFTLDGTGSGSTCYAGDGPALDPDPNPGEMAMVITGQDTGTPVLILATG